MDFLPSPISNASNITASKILESADTAVEIIFSAAKLLSTTNAKSRVIGINSVIGIFLFFGFCGRFSILSTKAT